LGAVLGDAISASRAHGPPILLGTCPPGTAPSWEDSITHLAVGTRCSRHTAKGKQAAGRTWLLEPGMIAAVYLHKHADLQHALAAMVGSGRAPAHGGKQASLLAYARDAHARDSRFLASYQRRCDVLVVEISVAGAQQPRDLGLEFVA